MGGLELYGEKENGKRTKTLLGLSYVRPVWHITLAPRDVILLENVVGQSLLVL